MSGHRVGYSADDVHSGQVTSAGCPTPLTADTIVTAPKVLLHDHLDGGLRPATLVDLAEQIGYAGAADHGGAGPGQLVRRVRILRLAGALPGDLHPHHRR